MLVRCREPVGSNVTGIRVVSRNYIRPSSELGDGFFYCLSQENSKGQRRQIYIFIHKGDFNHGKSIL